MGRTRGKGLYHDNRDRSDLGGELLNCNKSCVTCIELYCPWKGLEDAEDRADREEAQGNFAEFDNVRNLIKYLHSS